MTLKPDPSVQTNRYTYGNADPVSHVDPSGHHPLLWLIRRLILRELNRAAQGPGKIKNFDPQLMPNHEPDYPTRIKSPHRGAVEGPAVATGGQTS